MLFVLMDAQPVDIAANVFKEEIRYVEVKDMGSLL
jgi:hypothetical protein